ncbi:membrane protein [Nocardia camponoti]|uniref:Membrane protein n=2 Tax=Nocardia camponoti TaxID=1616106 RepID=A0A917QB25_9NOCA|nr:membrane protein [Nocardia camponoti]
MGTATVHPRIELAPIRPPQRLAPYSYALGAEVLHPEAPTVPIDSDGDAFGRLILLHDPDGDATWNGVFRLVAYIQADIDAALAADPLLPEVAWSWLVDALESRDQDYTALGGTVTATSSVRYGDIAGPPRAHQLELRASWTAMNTETRTHVEAFAEVLAFAAGLPPAGITHLRPESYTRTD